MTLQSLPLSPSWDNDLVVLSPTGDLINEKGDSLNVVKANVNQLTGGIDSLTSGGVSIPLNTVHAAYWCHLYSGGLIPTDDVVFTDTSGNSNHGVRGANLSPAQMWATANYCSSLGPVTGALDSTISVPETGFDYDSGETLFVFWRGKAAAPSGTRALMGDMQYQYGLKFSVNSSGYVDYIMYGAGSNTSGGTSSHVVADGGVHDFAFLIDGTNKKSVKWVDGALVLTQTEFGLTSGNAVSLRRFNIGCYAGLLNNLGMNCSTRTFVIMKWGGRHGTPKCD